MGDQIGEIVNGKLFYIPLTEFSRVLSSKVDKVNKLRLFASMCRINVLYMVANAGSGHLGSSFSSMEIMSYLLYEIQEMDLKKSGNSEFPTNF